MKRAGRFLWVLLLCIAMLFMIFDSKTALNSAQEGLSLCIQTVIPSLFPFMVITSVLTGAFGGTQFAIIRPFSRFCKMTPGTESLLLVGLLGGYPVGAKCIYEAWSSGQITKADAHRFLGFCNNAGPSFIFGMCSVLFKDPLDVWFLWGIHILSALLVGHFIPKTKGKSETNPKLQSISFPEAMKNATAAIMSVCGWVIIFRVIITFMKRWVLWLLPGSWIILFEGVLELTNGCASLQSLGSAGIRFVLCATFLGFGGLCVALQTASVVGQLGTGMYFPGKVAQGFLSCCFAGIYASMKYQICSPALPCAALLIVAAVFALKKTVAFLTKHVYNEGNDRKGEKQCYSGRKLQSPAAIVPAEQRSTMSRSFASKEASYLQMASAVNLYTTPANEFPLSPKH